MSQDSKHPNSALHASRHGLLNELDDIRSLLGEDEADLLDIPLLEPEGDAHTQIPLLDSAVPAPTASADPLQQALAERENPFLPRAAIERLARERQQMPAALRPAPAPAPTPAAQPASDAPCLDDRAMRALVDETLAVWLPRIERELRERLMRELRGEDD